MFEFLGTVMVNDATVVTPDIRTSNGIIHAIDKVILPNGDLPSEVGTGTSDDEVEEELGSGPIACTLDVYTCPDGTSLGREGPDCEFPECPTVDASSTTVAVAAGKASKAVGTKATKTKTYNHVMSMGGGGRVQGPLIAIMVEAINEQSLICKAMGSLCAPNSADFTDFNRLSIDFNRL